MLAMRFHNLGSAIKYSCVVRTSQIGSGNIVERSQKGSPRCRVELYMYFKRYILMTLEHIASGVLLWIGVVLHRRSRGSQIVENEP